LLTRELRLEEPDRALALRVAEDDLRFTGDFFFAAGFFVAFFALRAAVFLRADRVRRAAAFFLAFFLAGMVASV